MTRHAGGAAPPRDARTEQPPLPAAAAPLTAVLAQVQAGAPSLAAIAERTGLAPDLVRMAVDRLVAVGRLAAEPLLASCPGGGCGTCPVVRDDGSTCAPAGRGAPVLLRLSSG